jgi:hypothetical protein
MASSCVRSKMGIRSHARGQICALTDMLMLTQGERAPPQCFVATARTDRLRGLLIVLMPLGGQVGMQPSNAATAADGRTAAPWTASALTDPAIDSGLPFMGVLALRLLAQPPHVLSRGSGYTAGLQGTVFGGVPLLCQVRPLHQKRPPLLMSPPVASACSGSLATWYLCKATDPA